ncbi:hypothetical protein [Sphingomonas sp. 37zxx]|nr:hypothetical protein [Sphingomonas sp. 37zxx]
MAELLRASVIIKLAMANALVNLLNLRILFLSDFIVSEGRALV